MPAHTPNEAAIPNPALEALSVLVGEWTTTGSHPLMEGVTLHGHVSFEWIEGGAFLLQRSEIEEPRVPSSLTLISRDDHEAGFSMLYFDERGVSRIYQMTLGDNVWRFWRNVPGFSQRFTGTFADGGATIVGVGEMLEDDGKGWKGDLELTYRKIR